MEFSRENEEQGPPLKFNFKGVFLKHFLIKCLILTVFEIERTGKRSGIIRFQALLASPLLK